MSEGGREIMGRAYSERGGKVIRKGKGKSGTHNRNRRGKGRRLDTKEK